MPPKKSNIGSYSNVPDNQTPSTTRMPTAGDKRKQMQLMNNIKRSRLSIDTRHNTYQIVNNAFKSDNDEIQKLLYSGPSMPTSNKQISQNFEIYKRKHFKAVALKKKIEEQNRLLNFQQSMIVISVDEQPTSSRAVMERDRQAMEPTSSGMVYGESPTSSDMISNELPTSSNMVSNEPTSSNISDMDEFDADNCKNNYGRGKIKPLSMKSQERIMQNLKNYNNNIPKGEPIKNIKPVTRKKNSKSSQLDYHKIVNIGFAIMPKGPVYKCYIVNCKFQSNDKDIFRKHVVVYHDSDWDLRFIDSCSLCQKGITLETLEEEFNHMINCHVNADTSQKDQSLPITIDVDDDKPHEIVIIDLVEESQDSSHMTLTLPDTINSIADPLDVKSIEEQLEILDDDTNAQNKKKIIIDNKIEVSLVEKTIEEQLQILDSVQDSPTKVIIPLIKCVICSKADRFDMIKCNDCESWIHNTCKQDTESGKKCQHLKHFNFSNTIDKPKELSTDDLLEILSPGIKNVDDRVKEAASNKYYQKPCPARYKTRAYSVLYNAEPTPAKYESRSYSNNYDLPIKEAASAKHDKEVASVKQDKEVASVNQDNQQPSSYKNETKDSHTKCETKPTHIKDDKKQPLIEDDKKQPLVKDDTKSIAKDTEKILLNKEVEEQKLESSADENVIDLTKNKVDLIRQQPEPDWNDAIDLTKNKVDLNRKKPENFWNDALPIHEVFKLINKNQPKTKFFKFSAMQPWEQTRPNVKSKRACASMTSKNGLISTYKCLGKMCSFFTSNEDIFHKHLELHSRCKKDSLYDFFLFCSYCSYEAKTIDSLINHVKELHCSNQYQCPFCFYRSIEAQSCSVHVKNYHNEKPLIFYECPVKDTKNDVNKIKIRLLENRKTFVLPVSCSGKFNFISHIKSCD